MRALLFVLLVLPLAATAQPAAVGGAPNPAREGPHRQHGPRFGVTYLSPGVVRLINEATAENEGDERIDPSIPLVSQFGWQFEFETFRTPTGAMGVVEIVPLLSALDKGIVVPSLTVVTGVRSSSGLEIGAGPNVSLSTRLDRVSGSGTGASDPEVRVGLALAVGTNLRADGFNIPVSVATVLGAGGVRASFLIGLNTSSRRY